MQLRGEGREGAGGAERAGARWDSLALRCPALTTQPDGPGSEARGLGGGKRFKNAEAPRRKGNTFLICANLRHLRYLRSTLILALRAYMPLWLYFPLLS